MPANKDEEISFFPTKKFFVETLTKDVDLNAAILDLIDNSIDNYSIRSLTGRKKISITFNSKTFCIEDNCGGMDFDKVRNEIFRLGAVKPEKSGTIGYYGIGLKRAMFKIGKNIELESDDGDKYFSIVVDEKWLNNDENWHKGFEEIDLSKGESMFKMTVKSLYPDVAEEFGSTTFQEDLIDKIREVYTIYIQKQFDIFVNSISVDPYEFKFLDDGEKFSALREEKELDGVKVQIVAGFTRESGLVGWTVFCNDRIVLMNNKSYKTGFIDVNFHPYQDNEFLGMVFFNSEDPSILPMNTTKDDIAPGNKFYKSVQPRMGEITKNLIQGLTRRIYEARDSEGEIIGKSVYENIGTKPWYDISLKKEAKFPKLKISKDKKEEIETVKYTTISYQVEKKDIKKVKKHMGNPWMSNKNVGWKTYQFYKKIEDMVSIT